MYLLSISPVLLLVALLAWGLVRSGGNPGGLLEYDESGEVTVQVKPAPEFNGVDLVSKERVNNESVRGKIVMVDFWSSWCVACRIEAAALAEVYHEYAEEPVEFVGIAIWDLPGDTLRHLDRYGVTYPNILDERGVTAVGFGVRGVPEKFFLDREGRIIKRLNGPLEPERLREIIDGLLTPS